MLKKLCSAQKGNVDNYKLPLGTMFSVLGPPSRISYHVNP